MSRHADRMKLIIITLSLIGAACASTAQTLVGTASVIDGDTIEIHDQRIRLHGIDAPEGKQRCALDGQPWRCGTDSARALDDLIGGKSVDCEQQDIDRYGRIVATCAVGEIDVNAWLVHEGWAVAYREYSHAYDGDEDEARVAKRGLWAGEFDMPWDWRKAQRQ
jgi:endonuclease YncB( thermonuclease family)